tara:strand:+ start:170 stop:910 length:741 start_codon:yes stop_codon:yes gene_type:complete
MSFWLPEKNESTLEANSESEYEEDEIKYNDEDIGETCSWYWCIKCEENFGWEYNHKQYEQNEKWLKLNWRCNRCKPKAESIFIYKARSEQKSYDLMRKDIDKEPYSEPYSLCNKCFHLHDDDYRGKCQSYYNDCKKPVGYVNVYYGHDHEDAKRLARKKIRDAKARKKIRDAEDNTDESPTKKQKVNVIDLTIETDVETDVETDETDDETGIVNVVETKKCNGWSENAYKKYLAEREELMIYGNDD